MSDITEPPPIQKEPKKKAVASQTLLDSVPLGIALIAKDGTFLYINPRFKELFGYDLTDIPDGRTWFRKTCPDPAYRRHVISTWTDDLANFKTGDWRTRDFSVICKNGTERIIQFKAVQLETEENLLTCVDISKRKQMEEALRESEEKYRRLVEHANQGILIAQDGMIKFPNPKILEISGYSRVELCSRPFIEFIHPEDREMVRERHERRLEGRTILPVYDFRIVDKKGHIKWLELNATLITWEGRPATLNFLSDISKRKEAEEKVTVYQEQLRSLASELSLIEARERRQIATDLHDHIGQNLALAKMKLGELRGIATSSKVVGTMDKIREYVEESINFTRSLTSELSPPILYEVGFEAAVEWLTEQMQERHKIPIECDCAEPSQPMREDVRVFLFKATKELLTNIVKHAQAKKAKVSIRRDENTIRILVEDDGIGFNPHKDGSFSTGTGFGLFSIHERLKFLEGRIDIESTPGAGTRVALLAPLGQKGNRGGRGA